jgi:uncharacterized membrane protein YkvA (DUF1232 family)
MSESCGGKRMAAAFSVATSEPSQMGVYNEINDSTEECEVAGKSDLIIPPQGGVLRNLILRVRLILRLLGDRRVSPWLKIIPVLGLLYLISPLDLIPDIALPVLGELDDAAVLWLTNYLFVELCPPAIVEEHVAALVNRRAPAPTDDVVDAESVEVTEAND